MRGATMESEPPPFPADFNSKYTELYVAKLNRFNLSGADDASGVSFRHTDARMDRVSDL